VKRFLALLVLLGSCGGDAAAPDSRPDLVLVVIDTLRADHLSGFGYERPTSPALDDLGAHGALFLDATAQSSWTLPSMASLLSGRHLFVNAKRMPPTVPTLAERLRDAGYETVAFVGNPAVSPQGAYDRGFEQFIGRETTNEQTWTAPMLQEVLRRWLAAHPRGDRPRFVYLHFLDPHWPYEPPPDVSVGGTARIRNDTIDVWTQETRLAGPGTPIYDHFDEDRRSILEAIDRYDGEVALTDRVLGEILPELRASASGAGRELFTLVTADHGEMLWDHKHHPTKIEELPEAQRTLRDVFFRDHSYHMFQELVRVPLIAAGPGIPAGQRVDTPVENVDVLPTLLRAAGLPDDPEASGRALQDVLAGTARARPAIFGHAQEATLVRRPETGFKFIFPTTTGDSLGMPIQLYQLNADPHERDNLTGSSAPQVQEVLRGMISLREQAASSFHLYDQASAEEESPEQQRILNELGYTGRKGGAVEPVDPEEPENTAPADDGDR
jgi:arylsulfatase A-like enzyme